MTDSFNDIPTITDTAPKPFKVRGCLSGLCPKPKTTSLVDELVGCVGVLAVFGGVFLFGPQVMTGTNNSCHALEEHVVTSGKVELNGFQSLMMTQSNGNLVRRELARGSDVPTSVQCSGYWWAHQVIN